MKILALNQAIANNDVYALRHILKEIDISKEYIQDMLDEALIDACARCTVQPEIIDALKDYGGSKQAVFKALIGRPIQGIPPTSTHALLHDIPSSKTIVKRRKNLTTLKTEYILEEILSFEE